MTEIILGEPVEPEIHLGESIVFNATLGQAGLWTGHGAPTTIIGSKVSDEYLDLDSGFIYELKSG